jgi:hypothetical protein
MELLKEAFIAGINSHIPATATEYDKTVAYERWSKHSDGMSEFQDLIEDFKIFDSELSDIRGSLYDAQIRLQELIRKNRGSD